MATMLKQSTTVTIRLGPFLDATDGVNEETGLGSMGIEISKNHAAFAARNSATATAHDTEGWYSCELNATDTNTLGPLIVKAHASATHLPVWREFVVVPAHVYDGLVAGSDNLQVDTIQVGGTPQTAGDVMASLGEENVSASTGDPGTTTSTIAYLKQLINVLIGTNGIATFPAEAAPANAVSLAEVIRAIHADVTGLNGDAMRGTDNAVTRGVTGTADSGSTTTVVDAERTEADTDYWKGQFIRFTSGNLVNQVRLITDFNPATDTITFAPAATQAVSTHTYEILPAARVDLGQWLGQTPNALVTGRVESLVGSMSANVLTATAINTGAITSAKFAASAIDATAIASNAITSAKIAASAIGSSQIAASAIGASQIATGAITNAKFAAGAVDAAAIGTGAITATKIAAAAITSTQAPNLDAAVSTRATPAQVNTECDTALSDIGLHLLVNTALPTSWSADITANSALDYLADDGTAVYDRTTDSLQAIADSGGGGPTAAQIADAVWDEAVAGHVAGGSFGEEVQNHALSSEIAALNDLSAAEVNAEVDTALTDIKLHYLVNTALPTNWATDIAANSALDYMADDGTAVYDRTTDSLQAIADSGGGGPTAAQIADAVWDEAKSGHVGVGSFGEEVQAHALSLEVSALNDLSTADVDARLAAYDAVVPADLPANFADLAITATTGRVTVGTNQDKAGYSISGTKTTLDALNDVSTAQVNAECDTAITDAALATAASISALNNLSAAQVNAEVSDVLKTDTVTLPGQAAPPLTPTFEQMMGWLYKVLRNRKSQTATQWSLYADDEATVDAKATVSDDGTTAIKQEIVTGP